MLSIITACSRPDNLDEVYKSMDFKVLDKWYIIYDTSKGRDYTFKYTTNPKVIEIKYDKEGVCGHPQINYGLSLIKEGFVYIMDDDNIVHPDFWKVFPSLDSNYIYTWDQNRIQENKIVPGGIIELGKIDTSQFIVPRNFIGNIRWIENKRGADFAFINAIYKAHKKVFKYIHKILCYHNYLYVKKAHKEHYTISLHKNKTEHNVDMPCNSCKQYGGMPLSYVNRAYTEPSASAGSNMLSVEAGLVRPVINPRGGRRNKHSKRKQTRRRGGFYPSVMGSFLENASRLAPAAAVTGYRMVRNYGKKTRKNRK